MIAIETDEAGIKYMGFKRIKERFEVDLNFNIVYQPFINSTSIAFMEDIDSRKEVHKITLKSNNNVIGVVNEPTEEKYRVLNNEILSDDFSMFDYKAPKKKETTNLNINIPTTGKDVIFYM